MPTKIVTLSSGIKENGVERKVLFVGSQFSSINNFSSVQ
jgi:hypothetical protein